MAEGLEPRDDDWADRVAWWTFVVTIGSAVLFVGSVFLFILNAGGGH